MSLKRVPTDVQKPLRKIRALSGYNLWHRQYLQSNRSASQTLAAANSQSGMLWQALPDEERRSYNNEAKVMNECGSQGTISVKKERKRILTHLQEVSEHAEALKECEVMYVVVHKGEHYIGGTEAGVQFVKQCGAYIPYSFIGYLNAKQSGFHEDHTNPDELPGDKNQLRRSVESLFNQLYSQYVNSKVKLPYSKIEEFGITIDGLPTGTILKHPSSYGKAVLQAILDNKENLRIHACRLPVSAIKQKQV